MSQENVEIVRGAYDAFAAGGVEMTKAFFAPDCVHYPFPEWVGQSKYRGSEGLGRLLAEWTDNFDDFRFEVGEIRQAGDSVLMLGETVGRIKGSGVPDSTTAGGGLLGLPRRPDRRGPQLPYMARGTRTVGLRE